MDQPPAVNIPSLTAFECEFYGMSWGVFELHGGINVYEPQATEDINTYKRRVSHTHVCGEYLVSGYLSKK